MRILLGAPDVRRVLLLTHATISPISLRCQLPPQTASMEGVASPPCPASEPASRPLAADDPRLAPWRAFLVAHARISRRLDEELRSEHDLSLAEYDALLTIARAPGRRIRMGLLADEVILSKSGVTRLIDRLVSDGLVERGVCLSDARGAEAVLTDAGLARMRAASRTHLRGISEHFLDVVDPADLEASSGR